MNQSIKCMLFCLTLTLGLLVVPKSTSAQAVLTRQEQLCSQLQNRRSAVTGKLAERTNTYSRSVEEQNRKLTELIAKQDEKISSIQAKADLKRAQVIDLIYQKQQDDTDKVLVEQYSADIEAAVKARRDSFNQAHQEYKQSVLEILEQRSQSTQAAITEFKASVEASFSATSRICSRSGASAGARQEFVGSLQQARLKYSDFLRSRPDFALQLKVESDKRNVKIQQATAAFEQAMNQLNDKYKTAIKV